jgi:hypothetical protein
MSSYEYNQLLQFLYFEGYADSYADAEELLESISDEEFEDLLEKKYDRDETLPSGRTPRQNMERQRAKHGASYMLRQRETRDRNDPEAGSHFERASTMDTVKKAQDAGEEPRNNPAWKNTIAARRRPRASYEVPNERPGGLRAKNTTAAKVDDQGRVRSHRAVTRVNKEELEMQEAWYSGRGQYRTTVSGRKVRWDEDDATDDAVSAMMQKRREEAAKKAAAARLKAKGIEPIRKPKVQEDFESYAENLQNEGYDLSGWTWEGLEEYYLDEAKKASPEVIERAKKIKEIRNKRQKLARMVVQSGVGPEHPAAKQAEKAGVRPDHLPKHLRKEEVEELDERKYAHSFPLTPSEKKIAARIRARLDGQEPVETPKSARKVEPTPEPKKRTIKRTELKSIIKDDFDALVEHLFVKGYTDTIESAELMAENISEDWAVEILDEKFVKALDTTGRGPDHRTRFPRFKGKDDEFDPQFTQQRVNRNDKKIDPYFSGRRTRKAARRQGTGGFNA